VALAELTVKPSRQLPYRLTVLHDHIQREPPAATARRPHVQVPPAVVGWSGREEIEQEGIERHLYLRFARRVRHRPSGQLDRAERDTVPFQVVERRRGSE